MEAVVWVQRNPPQPYPRDWPKSPVSPLEQAPSVSVDLVAMLRDGTATRAMVRDLLCALRQWWQPRAKTLWPHQSIATLINELDDE
jgi:hypothetical protein